MYKPYSKNNAKDARLQRTQRMHVNTISKMTLHVIDRLSLRIEIHQIQFDIRSKSFDSHEDRKRNFKIFADQVRTNLHTNWTTMTEHRTRSALPKKRILYN